MPDFLGKHRATRQVRMWCCQSGLDVAVDAVIGDPPSSVAMDARVYGFWHRRESPISCAEGRNATVFRERGKNCHAGHEGGPELGLKGPESVDWGESGQILVAIGDVFSSGGTCLKTLLVDATWTVRPD